MDQQGHQVDLGDIPLSAMKSTYWKSTFPFFLRMAARCYRDGHGVLLTYPWLLVPDVDAMMRRRLAKDTL